MSLENDGAKRIVLVDGSGFLFRAFHGLPPLARPDGTPVNAVLGFTNMLWKLLRDMEAEYFAVIFATARKTFRNDIYPDYKAHRPPPPDELIPQFDLVRDACRPRALGSAPGGRRSDRHLYPPCPLSRHAGHHRFIGQRLDATRRGSSSDAA